MKHQKIAVILIFLVFCLFLTFSKSNAQPETINKIIPKSYICYKCNEPLVINGNIDKALWQKAEWTDYFQDIEGSSKPAPLYKTRAKMLWDDKYLYIAAELEEPDVWATLRQRDTVIFYDNDFEVFIDPDGDTHQYYEFEMNAFNTVWDLLLVKPYRDGGPAINAWDIKGLKTGVKISGTINRPGNKDKGWTLEIAFPWEILKECSNKITPPLNGDQWRINFSRVEWKIETKNGQYKKQINPQTGKPYPEDNWVWSPQGVINMHCPETWAFVQFSDKSVGTGKDIFLIPQDEYPKWSLRQLYYKQKEFFEKNTTYSSNINELNLPDPIIETYVWPPTLHCTPSLFEFILSKKDGKDEWHINQEGKTWKVVKSNK